MGTIPLMYCRLFRVLVLSSIASSQSIIKTLPGFPGNIPSNLKLGANVGCDVTWNKAYDSTTHPSKIELLKEFQSMGVDIVQGELDKHEKLVSVIQQVDVVISALAYPQVLDQRLTALVHTL
ncbi:Eugenol synthase 1 [Vitis vinifera]|uniref:Eugenol synthase 1 n=1 Tax=Vitis vinifera TaxID=29760 RepID=A0A438JMP1_VITVI|nr:Eugenol synthase 1 [Vitis vinifera]